MHSRTRKIVVLVFALATFVAVGYAVRLSLNPDLYFFRVPEDKVNWTYHPSSVAIVCGAMLLEAVITCWAFVSSRPRSLWVRSLLGLLVLGPWSFFSTMFVVHMPGYTLFHHLWVWLLVSVLAVSFVGSMSWQIIRRFRNGPPDDPSKSTPLGRVA